MEKSMENEGRKITKIAREVNKFILKSMKETDVGISEMDLIHLVRHNPGMSQSSVCLELNGEKGAIAKRVHSLEKKGYLIRKVDIADKRKHLLYATDKAYSLKNSKVDIESTYYEWLLETLSKEEKEQFLKLLDKLYINSKKESRTGFPHVLKRLK